MLYLFCVVHVTVTEASSAIEKRLAAVLADSLQFPSLFPPQTTISTVLDQPERTQLPHKGKPLATISSFSTLDPTDSLSPDPTATAPTIPPPSSVRHHDCCQNCCRISPQPQIVWPDLSFWRSTVAPTSNTPRYSGATQTEPQLHPRVEEVIDESANESATTVASPRPLARQSSPPSSSPTTAKASSLLPTIARAQFAASSARASSLAFRQHQSNVNSTPRRSKAVSASPTVVSLPSARIVPSPRRQSPRFVTQ